DGPVFISDRLMSAFEINDAEAAHTDSDAVTGIMSMIVWAAVNHHLAHSLQQGFLRLPALPQFNYAVNATHIILENEKVVERECPAASFKSSERDPNRTRVAPRPARREHPRPGCVQRQSSARRFGGKGGVMYGRVFEKMGAG